MQDSVLVGAVVFCYLAETDVRLEVSFQFGDNGIWTKEKRALGLQGDILIMHVRAALRSLRRRVQMVSLIRQ